MIKTTTITAQDPKAGMSYSELRAVLEMYRDPEPDRIKVTVGIKGQPKAIELIWTS